MTTRTTKAAVTFTRPFSLSGFDGEQPAGPYSVETDEELLDGVSFPAYRRTETRMYREDVSTGIYGCSKLRSSIPNSLKPPSRWTPLTPRHMTPSSHGARCTCRTPWITYRTPWIQNADEREGNAMGSLFKP